MSSLKSLSSIFESRFVMGEMLKEKKISVQRHKNCTEIKGYIYELIVKITPASPINKLKRIKIVRKKTFRSAAAGK
ncbi:hypothetical protein DOZ58_05710 [Acetobacterium sp. KB-1]|jgi:hypothetical protein|nr:hypothetical protein DOZ58_05710 [Acetobacterium sp. KB-1]